jgi:hypothetical protein
MLGLVTVPFGTALSSLILLAAFGYSAYRDVRDREVDDTVWLLAGLAGGILVAVELAPAGTVALVSWLVVAGFVLEHVLPWDASLERVSPSLPGMIELAAYIVVGVFFLYLGYAYGVGPSGLPIPAVAAFLSVVFARTLFEFGVLYGGADAKAVMVAGLVLPVNATPLFALPSTATSILGFYPFTLTLLMDAAVFAIVIPLGLAVRNLRAGTFEFPRGFTSYRLPVVELPRRFVWLRDPAYPRDLDAEESIETSEQDHDLRVRQAETLRARGVETVWVTPQLPFIVLLAAGALAAILVGNLLFDLFSVL